jgi:hypothetical protein
VLVETVETVVQLILVEAAGVLGLNHLGDITGQNSSVNVLHQRCEKIHLFGAHNNSFWKCPGHI